MLFIRHFPLNPRGAQSSGENGSPPPAQVTVEAAHFPTAGGMFRDALGKLSDAPSLLWVDLPCDRNDFDEEGGVNGDAALWASKRRDEKDLGGDNGNGGNNGGDGGPVCEEHWTSLAEVRKGRGEEAHDWWRVSRKE